MVSKNNCMDMRDFIMLVNCYNDRLHVFITAKFMERNVAVVTRVDYYNSGKRQK
jgi:hypothetical protein